MTSPGLDFSSGNMSLAVDRLARIKARLERYDQLQRSLAATDVAVDGEYQRTFRGFYRMRRGGEWCKIFFSLLQRRKTRKTFSFGEALDEIQRGTGRFEASFSSKLIATINPDAAVWDREVLRKLNLKKPNRGRDPSKYRRRIVDLYSSIQALTSEEVRGEGFRTWKRRFDAEFPAFTHFTDMKKLDLFLWQYRRDETASGV